MNTILLATDFTEFSENAGKYATHLAQQIDAKIHIIHAYHVPVIDPMTPAEYLKELSDSIKKEAEEKLNDAEKQLKVYAKKIGFESLEVEQKISYGFATGEILSYTEEINPSMLVLGARHLEGLEKAIFGSVNQPILEKAGVPVLLVPANAKYAEDELQILYATDFKAKDQQAISTLLELSHLMNARIHCVHFDMDGFTNIDQADMEEIEKLFESEKAAGKIDFQILSTENFEEGMSEYIKNRDIDIVAMLTQKRNFFESLLQSSKTKSMASRTDIPLIAFQTD